MDSIDKQHHDLFSPEKTLEDLFLEQQRINAMREHMAWLISVINGFLEKHEVPGKQNYEVYSQATIEELTLDDPIFLKVVGGKVSFRRWLVDITAAQIPFWQVQAVYDKFLLGLKKALVTAGVDMEALRTYLKPFESGAKS